MDFALVAVTVLSLSMTIAMAVVTWRLLREERRRSAARIAALTAEIERTRWIPDFDLHPQTDHRPVPRPSPAVPTQARRAPLGDLPIRPAQADPPATTRPRAPLDLFAAPSRSSGGARLASAMAGAAIVIVMTLFAAIVASHSRAPHPAADSTAGQPLPIELVALDHERRGRQLSIAGTVRNPSASVPAEDLSVVALAFDQQGAQVATGRSPLARAHLLPGETSSFSVLIPAQDVSRYRISFLTGGTTVPHVDRRTGAVARAEVPPDAPGGQP